MLAHRLEESLREALRFELVRQVVDDSRIQRDGEAVLEELRRSDLQQRAVVEVGTEKDMGRSMSASCTPVIIG